MFDLQAVSGGISLLNSQAFMGPQPVYFTGGFRDLQPV